ncbi:2'-deoxymugineic-acid 2'-dioxygenase-like [Oryza brachyantha]|uniref:Fe2OG dioxygenase domain-containing protein n=1 Tax=Oryza brachyantha TaxID=4533 RepID=J3MIV5_ORYBR|nr:2'-deoxymugineic-acid 2'-dioxygenase-like [Oryza brachyantha]
MEKLLSSSGGAAAASQGQLPDCFVFPADRRPPASSTAVSLPVIDLSGPRDDVRRAVLEAGKELGFFQVVNHGVPEQAMRDMEAVCEEFFGMPAEEKAAFYSDAEDKPNRLFSSTIYEVGGQRYWRDCLRLACGFPVSDDTKTHWPDKPHRLREVAEKFFVPTRRLGIELLRLLSEGMGLRPDYFEGDLTAGDVIINVNHYPPCPDPSLTLGLPPHCDRNLITLLLQGDVFGLQVSYKGDWINVEPVPNAFVVNFGHLLEIATNGVLKSIEHRAMTNSVVARTSVATFMMPPMDCLVGPARELVGGGNPPQYRAVTFREFMRIYKTVGARRESVEKAFKI